MQMDGYEAQQKEDKYKKSAEYYIAMILKGLMSIVTMVTKLIVQVIKGVLRTIGLPIPK